MRRERLKNLCTLACVCLLILAAGLVAWMAQSDQLSLGGAALTAALLGLAYLALELPDLLPSRPQAKRKTPTRAGTQVRVNDGKNHHKNRNHYNTAA